MDQSLQDSSNINLEAAVREATTNSILRFSTAGSVDDGKSTLIGRLLFDSKNIYDDHIASIEKASKGQDGPISLALLTDGLRAEREQGITIDVAYRYFFTPKRRFILADTPGHEQYTRNMATGASTADLTIILIDARKGVVTQTRRHAFIASLLGVPRLLVAINKMDLVEYSEQVFQRITEEFSQFAVKLGVRELKFIPVSALNGDNIVDHSRSMSWYHGESVLEYLENVYIGADRNLVDFRLPVQFVVRPNQNYRGFAGQILSGAIRVGEEVMALPSERRSKIKSIDQLGRGLKHESLESACAPMSVVVTLEDEIDVSRGAMLVRAKNFPKAHNDFESIVIWMGESPMDPKREYLIQHTSRDTKARIESIEYKVDVNTLSRTPAKELTLNEIGRVRFVSRTPLFLDTYQRNRATGSFIIIDAEDFRTVGAGLVIESVPDESRRKEDLKSRQLHREDGLITREEREARGGGKALTYWLTGLSGSGKSTIAKALERRMFGLGRNVYRLDGDNLRFGLNKDLGFSKEDRKENIRRVAEVARLFNEAGVSVICSFISPYIEDRSAAREVIGNDTFVEVYLDTPLEVCEKRDPHGLYKKARSGDIKDFTGISAPYEAPENPEERVNTAEMSVEMIVEQLLRKK